MKILKINILRGPNYWSNYRKKLIVLKIDLGKYEKLPTHLLSGFTDRLIMLLPSLHAHECSLHAENGFVTRLRMGTWLGHVIEHVALELQCLAGMNCTFGRTRSGENEGFYNVVFAYEIENAGVFAANAAFNIVESLADNRTYSFLEANLETLKSIFINESLGISTKAIVDEAVARYIPYSRFSDRSFIIFGHGVNQKIVWTTVTSQTSSIGVDVATDKEFTKQLLKHAFIHVPHGLVISELIELDPSIDQLCFPLVIKPINGNHGRGITANILTRESAHTAFYLAKNISDKIIIEHFISGEDYRFLVVNYKVVAVAKRMPPFVTGDGISTIQYLIDLINQDPKRGEDHSNILTKIAIDEVTLTILKDKSFTLNTILPLNEVVYLKYAANLSAGGIAIDVTDKVHPANIFLAERVASIMKLDLCGIDIIAENINQPITKDSGAVIEVNAAPGLRMHISPSEGQPRNVAKDIVAMLYPPGSVWRIPIVAITGTNGKTTTIRLVAYLASQAGYKVGYTSTDGIYINNFPIYEGYCSGPQSAQVVLQDPTINFAALECARGGILRSGLGFDVCDISIILNITSDHLGIDGIESLEELARLKSVVAHSTNNEGYAILNADDDLVYNIKTDLSCKVALFSVYSDNPRITQHCLQNGTAAYLEYGRIILFRNNTKILLGHIKDLPVTFNGSAHFMVENVLAAFLAGVLLDLPLADLNYWLQTFAPSPQSTPGRMNLFDFEEFQVLIDYAHNVGAYTQLKKYLNNIKCDKKIGIIAIPGDRRPDDIKQLGYYSALMFDEIIIRFEKDGRGKTNDQISQLLMEGINRADLNKIPLIIDDEQTALAHALKHAKKGDFIVHFSSEVSAAISYLEQIKNIQSRPSI